MTCFQCDKTDGMAYMSDPPQIKCSITNNFHFYDYECDVYKYDKPPLGLTPKKFCDEMRKNDIIQAMKRYSEANMVIPIEWINELEELSTKYEI